MIPPVRPPSRLGRRGLLTGMGLAGFGGRARAQSAGAAYSNDLVAAARKEGTVVLHSGEDAALLGLLARAFQTRFSGITVTTARADTEAQLQAFADGGAGNTVDVLTTTDLARMVELRRSGRLALFIPDEVKRWPDTARDPDGFYCFTALGLMVLGYNQKLVPAEQIPKSYADLLGPRFVDKLTSVHPGYSGGGLTASVLLANALGWPFFEQLARQGVLQVPSAAEAVERVATGERSAMVYGSEQAAFRQKAAGAPVGIVYPADGSPGVPSATAILREAPHPNAARLLATWMVGKEAQEIVIGAGARSFHPDMREPAGRTTLSAIKVLSPDPILISAEADLVKTFYSQLFAK